MGIKVQGSREPCTFRKTDVGDKSVMQMVKIRFPDPAGEAEGFVMLAKQVRVI